METIRRFGIAMFDADRIESDSYASPAVFLCGLFRDWPLKPGFMRVPTLANRLWQGVRGVIGIASSLVVVYVHFYMYFFSHWFSSFFPPLYADYSHGDLLSVIGLSLSAIGLSLQYLMFIILFCWLLIIPAHVKLREYNEHKKGGVQKAVASVSSLLGMFIGGAGLGRSRVISRYYKGHFRVVYHWGKLSEKERLYCLYVPFSGSYFLKLPFFSRLLDEMPNCVKGVVVPKYPGRCEDCKEDSSQHLSKLIKDSCDTQEQVRLQDPDRYAKYKEYQRKKEEKAGVCRFRTGEMTEEEFQEQQRRFLHMVNYEKETRPLVEAFWDFLINPLLMLFIAVMLIMYILGIMYVT